LRGTAKRALDVIASALGLIALAVPFAAIAAAIKIDSRGPVFFRHPRIGRGGRLFVPVKFRTMVAGAMSQGLGTTLAEEDPRLTRVGAVLRRWALDELPQLWNVLKGEMSLVGPRPELPYLVERYQPWQRKRFAVPQGMTGWWQVNGRSDRPMHLNTEEDLYYVQNYSILLDIQIMLKTIWVVLKRQGAY
jgi:lipopolysaccharide/colanic/teichoic acid biosynthesis glycosyltransferase